MKVYVHGQGITIAGKAWEIKAILREYGKKHTLVKDWVETVSKSMGRPD
ncbi:Z-ring formation inhibitor MciZ [Bacillus sp. ISL-35]|nr:Z-ring formation inhibitor MciZ [Bacillus sp. ISL-35]MBT2677631.1 Z-ring formation inhibitor MciZ [Bacillus sp. ISL-35]MBT2701981.1 Z-ring formation inhibitor MciZ [Chryseobacterium sp. ISL-80]